MRLSEVRAMKRAIRNGTWRYNPTSGDTPWIVGGAVVFVAGLWFLASRSPARAEVPPPYYPPPTPRPTPTPVQPPADMTFTPEEARAIGHSLVRQTSPSESVASVRILQTQLQDLGYAITRTDGRQSAELNDAVVRFVHANGLTNPSPVDLMRAVDAEYARVFGERGYV